MLIEIVRLYNYEEVLTRPRFDAGEVVRDMPM